jgi:methionine aminotransferase
MTSRSPASPGSFTPQLVSRLPQVGTTIFTVMSALAQEHGAVNLGQGFPDFGCDPALLDAVEHAMREGHNQYAPMPGVLALRQRVAQKIAACGGRAYDPQAEITITAGATQAILTVMLAVVQPGDEVILLDPCFDSYAPNVALCGGRAVHVPLTDGSFRPDFERIAQALCSRTRLVVINTPHNPTATVWTADDMRCLAELLRPTRALVISDEVYEHMVFDGARHESVALHAELAERAFVVSSFGKTLHVTGWKVGTVAAPTALMSEFRKVHQFNVFAVNTPMQHGLAAYLQDLQPAFALAGLYQRKRDLFAAGLRQTRLQPLACAGTYFQCVNYADVGDESEHDFCVRLTRDVGVAAIPLSAFYSDAREQRIVRFCFAKRTATLEEALRRLQRL